MCHFLDSGLGELKLPCIREKISLCLYTSKSRDISLRLAGNVISAGLVKFRVIAFSKIHPFFRQFQTKSRKHITTKLDPDWLLHTT